VLYQLAYRGVRTNDNVPGNGRLVSVTRNPLRVVIAEDEALIRLDLKEMLEEEGYSVVAEVGDGESAVERVTSLNPDLAILDVKMPVLDGISAAERIAAERIAPVVILTAFSQRELVERARDAGAMAYLVKPFTKADLVPAIEMAVSRFAEIRALDGEIGTLRERLEVRKLLDRAKGLLQSQHGLTEPEAFRWIQKTSMDRRLTMRTVAEAVIEGSMSMPAETSQPLRPGRHPENHRKAAIRPGRGPGCQQPDGKAKADRAEARQAGRKAGKPEPGEPLVPCPPSPADTLSTGLPGSGVPR
jgi:two-component system, response regulator PdtaR